MSRTSLWALAAAVLACMAGRASAAVTGITSIEFADDTAMVWPNQITQSQHHTLEQWVITDGALAGEKDGTLQLTNHDLGSGADTHTYTFAVLGDPFITTIIDLTNESTDLWVGYDVWIHTPVGATVSPATTPFTLPYSTAGWSTIQMDQQNTVIHFSGGNGLAPTETTQLGYKIQIIPDVNTASSVSYCVTGTPVLAPEPASLLLLAPAVLGLLGRRRK